MQRARYLLLGLILAASCGAYAITSGGFPYFPTFGSVTVKGAGVTATSVQALVTNTGTTEALFQAQSGGGNICLTSNSRSTAANCGIPATTTGIASTVAMDLHAPSFKFNEQAFPYVIGGTATLTLATGCTTTPPVTIHYTIVGGIAMVTLNQTTCTVSGTPTTFTLSGVPAALSSACCLPAVSINIENGGTEVIGDIFALNNTTWSVRPGIGGTFSGIIGIPQNYSFSYQLN